MKNSKNLVFIYLLLSSCVTTPKMIDPNIPGMKATWSQDHKKMLAEVNFKDEEMRVILLKTADFFGLNVIIPRNAEFNKKIDFKASNVSWEVIYTSVLNEIDYFYQIEHHIVTLRKKVSINLDALEAKE